MESDDNVIKEVKLLVEWKLEGKSKYSEKTRPSATSSQIPHDLAWYRSRPNALGSLWLNVTAVAQTN
jgi:hypothetical protein